MNPKILDWLRCPISMERLTIHTIESEPNGGQGLVKTGILYSQEGGYWFPIINGVPVMLIFHTALADRFAKGNAAEFAKLGTLKQPDKPTRPGEVQVQKTFTEEWGQTGHAEITFGYDFDELREMHRTWLYLPETGDTDAKAVWNVGCGHGQESIVLSQLFPNADIIALDLNLSLLNAAEGVKDHSRVHLVIGSVFAPPVADSAFDHVHSQGVIHHTYNTKIAFDSIEPKVKEDGSIFIWVYADEDLHQRKGLLGWTRNRVRNINDAVTRPILAHSPSFFRTGVINATSYATHWIFKKNVAHPDKWTLANTRHILRDAYTPPYIHRHGFNEMIHWFQDAGYDFYVSPAGRLQEISGRHYRGVGMVGRRNGVPIEPRNVAKRAKSRAGNQ